MSPRYHNDPLVPLSIGLPTLSLASPQPMRKHRDKAIENRGITRESTVLMIKQQKIASGTIITSVCNLIIINQRSSGKMTLKKSKKNLSLRSICWSNKTMRRTLKGVPRRLCSCETQQQLLQANMKSKECPLSYRKTCPTSRPQCLSMRLAASLWTRKCSASWLNSWNWTRRPPRK